MDYAGQGQLLERQQVISPYYRDKLTSLHVDRSQGHPKPHKVCLLLAIIDLIREGTVTKNAFSIDDSLRTAFSAHFKKLQKGNDSENILLPYFHLRTDGIWHFKVKPEMQETFNELTGSGNSIGAKDLSNVIEYAYLDEELFRCLQSEQCRIEAHELLLENLEDLSIQFNRWLLEIGKSVKTAKNYVGAIQGSISNWAKDANLSHQNLISIQSYTQINKIAEQLANYEVFQERNTKGNKMYSAALNSYQQFLSTTSNMSLTEDIDSIVNDKTIDDTQKARLVNTRIGQGRFREDLIKYWKGCAVTGYPATQFLLASHIKPWRVASDSERLDKYNGILLLPNLDKVFDLGYITFEDDGSIRISSHIEQPENLGLKPELSIRLSESHNHFMRYHRTDVYEKRRN